jgi:hypothetical protein
LQQHDAQALAGKHGLDGVPNNRDVILYPLGVIRARHVLREFQFSVARCVPKQFTPARTGQFRQVAQFSKFLALTKPLKLLKRRNEIAGQPAEDQCESQVLKHLSFEALIFFQTLPEIFKHAFAPNVAR